MSMPRFVAIQSEMNGKYLRLMKENKDLAVDPRFLSFTGDEIVSLCTKFELEPSRNKKGLVHIRCCYNNRYLAKNCEEGHWIFALDKQKEEDESKWSCTLFELMRDGVTNIQSIRFRHVHSHRNVCFSRTESLSYYAGLSMEPEEEEDIECSTFILVDWETLVILPKCVTFKGDDGKYLGIYNRDDNPYVVFMQGDISDSQLWNEVITRSDGSVCIKSKVTDQFWETVYSWLRASAEDSNTKDKDSTWFWPVKVDNQAIALRNYAYDNCFCARDPAEGWPDGFAANASIITKRTKVFVEEPVITRLIYNVDFRLVDARIYNKITIKIATQQAANHTNETQTIAVELPYVMTKIDTWNCNTTIKTGVKTSIQTAVPSISEGEVVLWDDFLGELLWGGTRRSSSESMKMYKVVVAPRTIVTVSLWATKGSCDVPFSYTQQDTMTDGQITYYDMDDGHYTGTTLFNFCYETKEEHANVKCG